MYPFVLWSNFVFAVMKFSRVDTNFELVTFLTKLRYGLQIILMQKGYVNLSSTRFVYMLPFIVG